MCGCVSGLDCAVCCSLPPPPLPVSKINHSRAGMCAVYPPPPFLHESQKTITTKHQHQQPHLPTNHPPKKSLPKKAFPDLRAAHFALPLSPVIAKGNDRGVPVVVADPLSPEAEVCFSFLVLLDVDVYMWGRMRGVTYLLLCLLLCCIHKLCVCSRSEMLTINQSIDFDDSIVNRCMLPSHGTSARRFSAAGACFFCLGYCRWWGGDRDGRDPTLPRCSVLLNQLTYVHTYRYEATVAPQLSYDKQRNKVRAPMDE